MGNYSNEIIRRLQSAGFRAAFLPYACIEQIGAFYDELSGNNDDAPFIRGAAQRFHDLNKPGREFEPLSFLIVACPSELTQVALQTGNGRHTVPIPPTYLGYISERQRLEDAIKSTDGNCQIAHTEGISHKLLAVCCGLGRFGRNNICYVEGLGSYCSLHAYYTDIPCEGEYRPPAFLDECETCKLCENNCPTGVIGKNPYIDATRCLTILNERRDPMPDWLPRDVHHTLIGCMRCQEVCPYNAALTQKVARTLELDAAETRALLSSSADAQPMSSADAQPTSSADALPPELVKKFHDFGMHDHFVSVIGRNAKLFLGNT